jgi:hypothetical protein
MHRLTFPFDQEMYDAGLVVRMSRSVLMDHVNVAAEEAGVEDYVRRTLVDAVSKKDVATVAVGAFSRSTVPDCHCPAMRAGYVLKHPGTVHESLALRGSDPLIKNFTFHFDAMLYRLRGNRIMAIEVVND